MDRLEAIANGGPMVIWPWQIVPILRKVMADQAALSAKIDKVAATLVAEIEQIQAALAAKVPAEIDLSPEIAKLKALEEAIAGIIPDEVPPAEESDEPPTEILEPGFEVIDGEPEAE